MSISSSNDRIPQLPFENIWLLIILSLVLFFFVWDWFWFSRGVFPLPKDDAKLWSYHRRRVAREENPVVLIGASRMLMGFNQSEFTRLTGTKSIQLAIAGQSPIPVLQHLAKDESFRGTIILDFSEYLVHQSEAFPDSFSLPNEWLKIYQNGHTGDDFEFWLRGQTMYLVANPPLGENPPEVVKNVMTGKVFESQTFEKMMIANRPIFFDRSMIIDLDDFVSQDLKKELVEKLRQAPVNAFKDMLKNNPPRQEQFLEIANKIDEFSLQIQSRGGRVIIVNFPLSGELADLNEIAFPKILFWDVLAANTSAQTIHYKDYPQLQFECYDGSHLDAKDTPKFTEELVKLIYQDVNKNNNR